ncbi:MAG: site-2 protease family protein [Clostridia bacterium]|nr:site-2 protease family protein [Clostridia bacterium]
MDFQNILAFLFVLGILIFVHELGHFTLAKLNKMHVYQFCLGLGPKLIKFKGKETTYAICALPIGGMVDLREDENDTENLRSFSAKKPWQRLVVILAGAIMNFVLAYVLIVGLFFSLGAPTNSNVLGGVQEDMPAYEAGIRPGDVIVEVNGVSVNTWEEIINEIVLSGNSTFTVTYRSQNVLYTREIKGVEGSDSYFRIGISEEFKKDFPTAIKLGTTDFLDKSTLIFDTFIDLVTGKIDPANVSGPVGIYKQVGEVAQTNDFRNLLYFTALLSVNLGIFNLLPFPFLDGGRAIFILYEMIFRKPFNKEKEAFVHFLGMIVLMALMVVLVIKDIGM